MISSIKLIKLSNVKFQFSNHDCPKLAVLSSKRQLHTSLTRLWPVLKSRSCKKPGALAPHYSATAPKKQAVAVASSQSPSTSHSGANMRDEIRVRKRMICNYWWPWYSFNNLVSSPFSWLCDLLGGAEEQQLFFERSISAWLIPFCILYDLWQEPD